MAELNFPKDRTELNPPGSGPLQTGDKYTANGTTWVYDADAGVWGSGSSGASINDLYLSKVNDDSAAGNITFEADTRVEGEFKASRSNQTDAVQVVPSTGSSQSNVLQVTRGASTSGSLPAIEVIQNGTETAQIQFDGRGRFSDVEITTVTDAASLGTDSTGKIISTSLDTTYLKLDASNGPLTGNLGLPGGGGDTEALQKQEIVALIAADDGNDDSTYLKLDASNGPVTGELTFNDNVRVEGQFVSSRSGQTDAVQVVPSAGSVESSMLQVTRSSTSSGNLPAFEVIQNGAAKAQIQFDGRGRFSDVEITTVTDASALGTDASGKIIDVGSTLDGKYLSSTEDDSAAGKITFEDEVTAEAGINLTGGGGGNNLYKFGDVYRLASPDNTSLFSVQDQDKSTSDSGGTVIVGTPKADASHRHCVRIQGKASLAGQDLVCAQAVPYQGGLAVNSVTGFYVGNLIPEGATSKPGEYRCFHASAATAFSPLVYGYYTDISAGLSSGPDASTNYAFYSAGTAASLLKGKLTVEGGFTSAGTDKDNLIQGGLTIGDSGDYVKVDDAVGSASNRMLSLVRSAAPANSVTALEVRANDTAQQLTVKYNGDLDTNGSVASTGLSVVTGASTPVVANLKRNGVGNAVIQIDNSSAKPFFFGVNPSNDFAIDTGSDLTNNPCLTILNSNGRMEIGKPTATSGVAKSLMVEGRLGCDGINPYTSGTANVNINSNGVFSLASSSARYKTDIETMQDAYADKVVDECRPVFYRPNPQTTDPENPVDPTHSFWGFIAEEVEQVDPRLCFYSKDEEGNDQVEGVAYDSFAPILLNVVKRQRDQIADLTARLEALEGA